jgi:hypothetical protein
MKKTFENMDIPGSGKEKSKITDFFQKQKTKLKHGQFTCPLCKEVFTGISAMGAHLKDHCT